MRCEACRGEGAVLIDRQGRISEAITYANIIREARRGGAFVIPCPECGGSGFAHCCEGERPEGQLNVEQF